MSELKPCPFCGCEEVSLSEIMPNMVLCSNIDCYFYAVYTPVMIWQSRPIEDGLRAELARRDLELSVEQAQVKHLDGIIARMKEDAETLASISVGGMTKDAEEYWECPCCMAMAYNAGDIHHAPDCPITLHRALMKELE